VKKNYDEVHASNFIKGINRLTGISESKLKKYAAENNLFNVLEHPNTIDPNKQQLEKIYVLNEFYIINCMNERTDEIVNDATANNKTFRELTQRIIPILDTIRNTLPSEYKELFEELEDILDKRELITYRMLYKQGYKTQ